MKIAFQMQALKDTDPKGTNSLILMQEAHARGYEVYHCLQDDLSLSNDGVFTQAARTVVDLSKDDYYSHEAYERVDLTTFDVVFMRRLPPVDTSYITDTYILETLKRHGVLVTNDPVGIRDVPEKLSIFNFPDYIPPTLVSRNEAEIKDFLSTHKDIIVKPLYLYTSKGIIRTSTWEDIQPMLEETAEPLMFQKFLPGIKEGKKRVILFDGKIVNAYTRVPEEGEFLTPFDGLDELPCTLTERELKICEDIGTYVQSKNIDFVGLDLVQSKLIEINVTCPGGIIEINEIYNQSYHVQFWDFIERKLSALRSA